MLFYWDQLMEQIRIEGEVRRLSEEESTAYFQSRPIKSQIAATCSCQSQPIASRHELNEKFAQVEQEQGAQNSLKKPENWGGFRLIPTSFEFWKGQSTRLHDRLVFRKLKPGEQLDGHLIKPAHQDWGLVRLQP